MTANGTYMYAITRPVLPGELNGLRGVSGAPVRMIDDGDVACLVSTVDLAEFGEEALPNNLEDLRWLERTARQHDEVVQAGARITTTMPLRLATICTDDTSAQARLHRVGSQALAVLADLDGREEWGVKLLASPDRSAPDDPLTDGMSGTAYLQRRRQQLSRNAAAAVAASRDADAIYSRLAEHAVAGRRHRPQDQRLTGAAQPMLLNASFLVERTRVGEFRSVVADLMSERPPESVTLTGPWAPYSFAAMDET
jgi:hypothetical protein